VAIVVVVAAAVVVLAGGFLRPDPELSLLNDPPSFCDEQFCVFH